MNHQLLRLLSAYWDKNYSVSLETIVDDAFFFRYMGFDWGGKMPDLTNEDVITYLKHELGID